MLVKKISLIIKKMKRKNKIYLLLYLFDFSVKIMYNISIQNNDLSI